MRSSRFAGVTCIFLMSAAYAAECVRVDVHAGETTEPAPIAVGDCYLVELPDGVSVQLSFVQNVDLSLRVSRGEGGQRQSVDAFEFGTETATLAEPGLYRIDVTPSPAGDGSPAAARAFLRRLAPVEGRRWARAERETSQARARSDADDARKAILLWEELRAGECVARSWLIAGDSLWKQAKYSNAFEAYERARLLCASTVHQRCLAEAASNSGTTARRLGDIEIAEARFLESISAFEVLGQPVSLGRTKSNLGLLQTQMGEFRDALRSYNDAAQLLKGTDETGYRRARNNLGITYVSLAEYGRAAALFRELLASSPRAGANDLRATLLGNLGWTQLRAQEYIAAESTLRMALQAARREGDQFAEAAALTSLGEVLLAQGRRTEARSRLGEARETARAVADRRQECIALQLLGALERQTGKGALSENLLRQSLAIAQDIGDLDLEVSIRGSLAKTYLASPAQPNERAALTARARQELETSLRLMESIRSRISTPALRATYYTRRREQFELLLDLVMAAGTTQADAEGFLLVEQIRGRALADLMTDDSLTLAPAGLRARRAAVHREIGALTLKLRLNPSNSATLRRRIQALLAEADGVEAEMSASVAQSGSGRPPRTVEEVQARLPGGSALLSFYMGERTAHAWVLTPSGPLRHYSLPGDRTWNRTARTFVDLFGRILERRRSPALESQFQRSRRRLSAALLGPLPRLPRRLLVVADGALHRIPIAALLEQRTGRELGLDHEILTLPSTSALLQQRPPRAANTARPALALADPIFSSSDPRVQRANDAGGARVGLDLARLPFLKEIQTLRRLEPRGGLDVLLGFDASVGGLTRRPIGRYGVVHLSTHAFIDEEEPQLSYIALSFLNRAGTAIDGLIRPAQIATWNLDGAVVVISSCDSAVGKLSASDGMAGFGGALLLAGASQFVLSLSPIDAEASSEFFSEFYRSYYGAAEGSTERAMWQATRRMAASPRWRDPYYWATYRLTGLPTN